MRAQAPDAPTKTCTKCGEAKPVEEFSKHKKGKFGRLSKCRPCVAEYSREYRAQHPDRVRESLRRYREANPDRHREYYRANAPRVREAYLLRTYGLSADRFDALLSSQGGGCAVCGSTEAGGKGSFHTDHDHSCCPGRKSCGKCVRGLLCGPCNRLIGFVEKYLQDPDPIDNYLRAHRAPADSERGAAS